MSDSFFITGGTLPLHADSYVVRQADTQLREGLLAGDFCYVLNTRQMGKSSLMVRTARYLQKAIGWASAASNAEETALKEKSKATRERDAKADALYASQMLELQNAYERKDLQRAKSLLEWTKDYPYKGFEWNIVSTN